MKLDSMKPGDLVTILYEKKKYCLIVARGGSSSFHVMLPNGSVRRIPALELRLVERKEKDNV